MAVEPYKDNGVGCPVKPYQQQVILYMTFHVSLVITGEYVRPVFLRKSLSLF